MLVHFYIRFSTKFGQTIYVCGNVPELGNNDTDKAVPLNYLNNNFWDGEINIEEKKLESLQYKYILKESGKEDIIEFGDDRLIDIQTYKGLNIDCIDTWQSTSDYRNNFYTQPFQNVLLQHGTKAKPNAKKAKQYTHEFKIKAPILNEGEVPCIIGSAAELTGWSTMNPTLLTKNNNWWQVKLNLEKSHFPVQYKYGIYNTKTKQFVKYEDGDNRVLAAPQQPAQKNILHDGYANFDNGVFRGAGVAIPVFSLRSKNSFGTGEFTDIKLLVDWAKQTGLKLIQLLPINDTIATNTWADSYPYAAISAFALHPLYLNLQQVAGKNNLSVINPLQKKQKQLNALTEVDYEQAIKFKLLAIKELYLLQKELLKEDKEYNKFFNENRHWLIPYAAFCYLRDKNNTSNFATWKSNSKYTQAAIHRLVSPTQKHYNEIAVHYFTQYYLHLQLKEATAYAHKNDIVVKGDLPIGIYRNSVDAWVAPELYNMDAQAGAPPDDFAVKGQNWGFPTYNWSKMQEDNYNWWRQRFQQMSNYFDAFRIDHILGFFRIWSIPLNAVEGILGKFVPALPIYINEFEEKGIQFNYERFCKPFITDAILHQTFGEDVEYVKNTFFNGLQLKDEFNAQRKVDEYFKANNIENVKIKIGLFDIISNIILIEEEGSDRQKYHFRIAVANTSSYQNLDWNTQKQLEILYTNYFYHKQDEFWKKEAMYKLPAIKHSTNMLICGEDLGMVPHCVPEVMQELNILSLEIQRMPKNPKTEFFNPKEAPYLSVVTPSTHDMSTIRGWWTEDKSKTQRFYNTILNHEGQAPETCATWVNNEVVMQHLYSPAMWSIFQLQDILGTSESLRRENANEEQINVPANPNHYWRYRMHIALEDLIKEKAFNTDFKKAVIEAGR